MATLGFSEAARLAGVSRQHLYRLVDVGELKVVTEVVPGRTGRSRMTIDKTELERVFGQLTAVDNEMREEVAACDISCDNDYKLLQIELEAVRRLLQDREVQLQEARSREEWLKTQINEAQSMARLLGRASNAKTESYVAMEKYQQMVDAAKKRISELRSEINRLNDRNVLERLFNK